MTTFKAPYLRHSGLALAPLLLALCALACASSKDATTPQTGNGTSTANANAAGAGGATNATDMPALDARIASLEKQAEKSPGDDELRRELSRAYSRRADALRNSGQAVAALRDYRTALRYDEDNQDAQQRAAEIASQVEGDATGENGEPAPLPITPNVTADDDDKTEDKTATPKPSPAKKKH